MKPDFLNPPGLCPTFGWSHVVCHTSGKTIYISGQTAVDAQGQLVGKGDLRAQAERAWECIGIALKSAGATFRDLVKTNLYVVNYHPDQLPILREARAKYVHEDNPPASTLVGVTALALPDWLIEIEAIAVVADELR
jgi:enamine deaminase RidA (YjgF/YER057c/UK114 family)